MKQIVLIISVCLSSLLYSCTDDNLTETSTKGDSEGKRNITFAISTGDDNDFSITTRAKGTVVTDDYSVKFYLFKKKTASQADQADQYELIRMEEITQPLYTIEDLETEATYKYTFVATSIANKSALDAMDFSSVTWNEDFTITLPNQKASEVSRSLIDNCYISFFDDQVGYGTFDDSNCETIEVTKDLDIFGCGAEIAPGMTFNTPINVIMERQFGVVEFVFQDAQVGDKLTCSFSSEYYRLYLTQMTKEITRQYYVSDNEAQIQADVFTNAGLSDYTQGDYYSASGVFQSGYGILPILKKNKTLASGENSIQVYVPYTTAEAVGNNVAEIYKANYIRTEFGDINGSLIKGQKGSVTLQVERGGSILKTYSTDISFPIYRNGKTIFRTVGDNFLQVNFGPADTSSDGGINLDGDGWHGEN